MGWSSNVWTCGPQLLSSYVDATSLWISWFVSFVVLWYKFPSCDIKQGFINKTCSLHKHHLAFHEYPLHFMCCSFLSHQFPSCDIQTAETTLISGKHISLGLPRLPLCAVFAKHVFSPTRNAISNTSNRHLSNDTSGLHNKISAYNIFARGWVAQKSFFS